MYVVVVIAMALALVLADQAPRDGGRWLALPASVLYLAGVVALGAFRTALSLRAIARHRTRRPETPAAAESSPCWGNSGWWQAWGG